MTLSAVKTLALASAVVLLGTLSDSVDARNQSVVAHHHKHAHQHEKAAACTKCDTTIDLNNFDILCYHKFLGHVNWFSEKRGYKPTKDCNCCDESITYQNEKASNWHVIYPKDETWCYTRLGERSAKIWYRDVKLWCDWA